MHKNLINGEWLDGAAVSRNINPSDTRDLIGEYAQADAAQAELAISAATAAFPAGELLDQTKMGALLSFSAAIIAVTAAFLLRVGRMARARGGPTLSTE